MEQRFGHDFSRVRLHTDARAAASAERVYARAYTVGSHVVFGAGQFSPSTQSGRELLGHELAHTIQQRSVGAAPPSTAPDGAFERSAEAAGRDVASGRFVTTALPASGVGLSLSAAPLEAYTDDMLARANAEVLQRLKQASYPGRDRDVDRHMALRREIERRARAAAVAEAEAVVRGTEPAPKEKPQRPPTKFNPGGFTNDDIYAGVKAREAAEKAREARERQARRLEEEGRPARLITVRRYLTLHGVSKWDMADVLTGYLTVNDLRVLRQNGLEAPGFFTRKYSDQVIAAIDKAVPPDRQTAALYQQDLETVQQQAANIRYTAEKIETVASEGPHALGGRVVGATTAAIVGKDPLWGGEVGAALAGPLDIRMQLRSGRSSGSYTPRPASSGAANIEPAPPRQPMPSPGPTEMLEPATRNIDSRVPNVPPPTPSVAVPKGATTDARPPPKASWGMSLPLPRRSPGNDNAVDDITAARQKVNAAASRPRQEAHVQERPLAATGTEDVASARIVASADSQPSVSQEQGATDMRMGKKSRPSPSVSGRVDPVRSSGAVPAGKPKEVVREEPVGSKSGADPTARAKPGLATQEEDAILKRYTRGLATLRERIEILQQQEASPSRDPKRVSRAKEARDSANRELTAIEDEAAGRSDGELFDHLVRLIAERRTLNGDQGLSATVTGMRISCEAVAQAPKNLRGMDFADIAREMETKRPPKVSAAKGLDIGGMPTGHQRLEWVFDDGSRLVIDSPRQLGGRPQSADLPHAELHGPNGERLDQQGIIVPEHSLSAHMTITDNTRSLEKYFAPARAKTK
ncbi:DUF4157 domain-containing protein [Myxococcus stipitatus]|nr:DUF4157 domain-containing protein [Myxococcus stipitatus]